MLGSLKARSKPGLLEGVSQVTLDGVEADMESTRDLLVAVTECRQLEHARFPRGQPRRSSESGSADSIDLAAAGKALGAQPAHLL
jgi:hypothetical protein